MPVGLIPVLVVLGAALSDAAEVWIECPAEEAPASFAADDIAQALREKNHVAHRSSHDGATNTAHAGPRIVFLRADGGADALAPEAYAIRCRGAGADRRIEIRGADSGGLLYGGLEVAEQIRLNGFESVKDTHAAPHFPLRGVKFNLPLDARTPSYSDMSDAAQANIAEVWNFEFWREFLDRLARNRYNFVSLWNLHPFPSLVRVPGYEKVALDDVWRSTIDFAEDYSTRTEDLATPEMLAQVEIVRRLTIDEKIAFWRRVMTHARDRNIQCYLVTWNLYTYGTGGQYGITDAIDNPVTIDYFRRSVAALFRTYPLLRGIGVTAGENLGPHGSSFDAKEAWLFATYGQGVLDAAREHPGRKIRFIHRQHETRAADIATLFAPLAQHPDIDFVFSFKYAQAHALSSTTQTFHREFVNTLGELKTLWTLRNDDALLFRWGAPDFVREFVSNMPRDVSAGVYLGSDMWIWGREFLSLDPAEPRELELAKHWYHWMLWGRLSYDPALDNERIIGLLAHRFPGVDPRTLFAAWQHASMTYPLTTGFHWGQFDFQWYIEACRSRPGPAQTASGFHDVNRFISLPPHPGTDNIGIPRFVEAVVAGTANELRGTPPPEVATALHAHATAALEAMERLDGAARTNRELRHTLADIRAMALLGRYYGHKISGATALALFRRTGGEAHREEAVAALTAAAHTWHEYTGLVRLHYRHPVWTNRVGTIDWDELDAEVTHDIAIAREATTAASAR